MPAPGTIIRGSDTYIKYNWSEFKKYINGTYYSSSYFHQEIQELSEGVMYNYYIIITQRLGGFSFECLLLRDGGVDVLDFENNFKDLPPRLYTASSNTNSTTKYDIQTDVIYIGNAKLNSATNAAVWTIKKIVLEAGTPINQQLSIIEKAIWDNRTTETYY